MLCWHLARLAKNQIECVPSLQAVLISGTVRASPCATISYAILVSDVGDTIQLADGTYTESGINMDRDITITGAGANTTILQAADTLEAGNDRVFDIESGNVVTIGGVTIKNGYTDLSGGGVRVNESSLTLIDVTVDSNATTGSSNSNGSGIEVRESWLLLTDCTISDNRAGNAGGGIYLYYSTAEIINSTFYMNRAVARGGAIGTLSDDPQTIQIAITTISTNNRGDYGGGIQAESAFTVYSSNVIVAHNAASNSPDVYGEFISQDYNLFLGTDDATIKGETAHNITGQCAGVGVLEYNGGTTKTLALKTSSPALDVGKCDGALVDQRGHPRPVDKPGIANAADGCDIGSYEDDWKVNLPLVVN